MPRRQGFIDIGQIKMDRWPMNMKTLALIDFMRSHPNEVMRPIKVQLLPTGNFKIKDGRHRILAYRMLGRTTIEAKWGVRAKDHDRCSCESGHPERCPDVGSERENTLGVL